MRPGRVRLAIVAGIVGAAVLAVGAAVAGVVVRGTLAAERGAENAIAAADGWVVALNYGQDPPGGYLCPDRFDGLRRQAAELRQTIDRHARGNTVRVGSRDWREQGNGDRAEVTAEVYLQFTAPGETLTVAGTPHPWRFTVERFGGIGAGWKVCQVDPPELCGTHLRCD